MLRTVSASEAKTKFGALVDWAVKLNEGIVVESHGVPKMAFIAFDEHQKLPQLRDEARRRETLARLERPYERVRAHSQDLSAHRARLGSVRSQRLLDAPVGGLGILRLSDCGFIGGVARQDIQRRDLP